MKGISRFAAVALFLLVTAGLSRCSEKSSPCESGPCLEQPCNLLDSRILGDWTWIEECECYSQGGDSTWQKVSWDLVLSFNNQCEISKKGEHAGTDCNQGRYDLVGDQINMTWDCAGGGTVKNTVEYLLSQDLDTLTLMGKVDEGFVGSKYYRQ